MDYIKNERRVIPVTRKLLKALQAILDYTQKKQPKDLEDAKHMLDLVGIIARETIAEHEMHESSKPPA